MASTFRQLDDSGIPGGPSIYSRRVPSLPRLKLKDNRHMLSGAQRTGSYGNLDGLPDLEGSVRSAFSPPK